jgi:hypothetical protein
MLSLKLDRGWRDSSVGEVASDQEPARIKWLAIFLRLVIHFHFVDLFRPCPLNKFGPVCQ